MMKMAEREEFQPDQTHRGLRISCGIPIVISLASKQHHLLVNSDTIEKKCKDQLNFNLNFNIYDILQIFYFHIYLYYHC